MKTALQAIGIVLLVGFVAGGVYLGIQIKKLIGLCVSFSGFSIKSIEDDARRPIMDILRIMKMRYVNIEVSLKLQNPSDLAITCEGYDIDVLLGVANSYQPPVKVGNVKNDKEFVLASNGTSVLTLPIEVDVQSVSKYFQGHTFLTAIMNKDYKSIVMTMQGEVTAKLSKLTIKKKINISETLQDIQDSINSPSVPCAA